MFLVLKFRYSMGSGVCIDCFAIYKVVFLQNVTSFFLEHTFSATSSSAPLSTEPSPLTYQTPNCSFLSNGEACNLLTFFSVAGFSISVNSFCLILATTLMVGPLFFVAPAGGGIAALETAAGSLAPFFPAGGVATFSLILGFNHGFLLGSCISLGLWWYLGFHSW